MQIKNTHNTSRIQEVQNATTIQQNSL